jgi:hypothetical protein
MERKLLITVDGMRLEFEGQEILLVKIPIPPLNHPPGASIDNVVKPIDFLFQMQKYMPVVLACQKSDGTLTPVAPQEWMEKLRSKTILAAHLTKVPIYEDVLEPPAESENRL